MKLESLKAWHGTEHKFDAFSIDHLGSGEGAQMYGWGMYFAEEKDVAKSYAPRNDDYEEELLRRYNIASRKENYAAASVYENAMLHDDPDDIRARFADDEGYDQEFRDEVNRVIDDELIPLYDKVFHGLYQVTIHANMDDLLDWFSSFKEQSVKVKQLLIKSGILPQEERIYTPKEEDLKVVSKEEADAYAKEHGWAFLKHHGIIRRISRAKGSGGEWMVPKSGEFTRKTKSVVKFDSGMQIYEALSEKHGGDKAASMALLKAGIPGIKYKDEGSRGYGEGTYNFVIFDDKHVSMDK